MSLDWSKGELAAGLNCYRREEFFDAHEHWENVWRLSQGEEKPFLQALIQVAGALHHFRRRNLRGTAALLRGALRRLEPYPERYGGLLLGPLRQELAAWLEAVESPQIVQSLAPSTRDGTPSAPGSPASPSLDRRGGAHTPAQSPELGDQISPKLEAVGLTYPLIQLDVTDSNQPDSQERASGDSQE